MSHELLTLKMGQLMNYVFDYTLQVLCIQKIQSFKVPTFQMSKVPRFQHVKIMSSQIKFPKNMSHKIFPGCVLGILKVVLVYSKPQIRIPTGPKKTEKKRGARLLLQ